MSKLKKADCGICPSRTLFFRSALPGISVIKKGDQCEITTKVDGAEYLISIVSFFGSFMNYVWRKEGAETIPIADTRVNPNPSKADRYIIKLLEQAAVLPPAQLPEEGLKIGS